MVKKLTILTAVTMVCVCALCLIYQNNSIKEANNALETYAQENIVNGHITRTYEMLIKKSSTGVGSGAYEAGDIIMIKPEGYNWSSSERNNFYIVKVRLIRQQTRILDDPKVKITDMTDKDGNYITETEFRRKYKVGNVRYLNNGDFITMDDIIVK
ncbi:hypothetical protein ACFLZ0_03165 [Patescibacteria group bacterium]